MYHYSLFQDDSADTPIGAIPFVTHGSTTEAMNAALDDLATRYVEIWPVQIRIYDSEENYVVSTKDAWEEDVKQHALKRIEEANKIEFNAIIETAHADLRLRKEQYEKGIITQLDFVKAKARIWAQAAFDIESKGG